jgi:hypothetical protein
MIGAAVIVLAIFLKYSIFPDAAEQTIKYPFNVEAQEKLLVRLIF